MIPYDLETSGTSGLSSGIVALGAVDMLDPDREFYGEARLDEEDVINSGIPGTRIIHPSAVHGISPDEMRNPLKNSQKKLIDEFNYWMVDSKIKILLCHNPRLDITLLYNKAEKYNTATGSDYRSIDLHTIAQTRYALVNGEILTKGPFSDMGLDKVARACGLEESYSQITKNKKGLQDARIAGECAGRMLYGESLFPQFNKFKIPKIEQMMRELKKEVGDLI